MKKSVRTGFSLLALIALQSQAFGADAGPAQGAYRLGEIVVSATPESIVEEAGTMYLVTAAEIKDQGATTLNEALELVPGLIVREGAEGTPRIDIRGFRTRHVQLFINGIPLRDTYDGQFDPTRIPADIISEIKVTSGGGSVLYGAGGNGGSIDIITKSGTDGLHGSAGIEVADGNSYEGKASVYGSSDKVDFYANLTVQDREAFVLSDDFTSTKTESGDDRDNSDRERNSVFTNLSYKATDNTTLGLTLSHMSGENGKPPATNYDKSDPFSKKAKYERIDDIESSLVQVAFAHTTDGPLGIRGWAYYSQTDMEENGYDDDSYTTQDNQGAFHQDTDTSIYGVSTQASYQIGTAASTTLGLTAENESWESEGYENKKDNKVSDLADDRDVQTYSVALEYEREITDKLGLVLGYGHHFQQRDEGDDNDFSYMIGATYALSESTRLNVNHARKIRFPSVKQLYGSDGNENLETEVTYHYEAGVQQNIFADGILGVTGFVINAEDFIEKIEVDGDDVTLNFQEISIVGIETDLTIYPVDDLMVRLAVTWLDTEDKSDDSARDELQYRPEWKLSAETRYNFDFGLSVYGSVLYVANQYFYDSSQTLKSELDDFAIVNLKFTQRINETGLEVYAGVDNLFDEDYEESYGLPQPGRTLYGGVEYRF